MKLLWLAICLCFTFASCKPKSPPPQVPTPAPTAVATQTPAAQPAPTSSTVATTGTPEQIGSTLRLRVAYGGLPARDTVAALLHRDEMADPALAQGKGRFVLALLKGWNESQLRSNDARLIVYRNKVNAQGETDAVPFPATLVQFDPATGLGIVGYVDTFEYASDVGFHFRSANNPARANLTLLRTLQDSPSAPRYRAPRNAGRFSVDAGTYYRTGDETGRVDLPKPNAEETADPVALAVTAPDGLCGFVETTPTGPVFTGLEGFTMSAKFPAYEVTEVNFEDAHQLGRYDIILTVTPGPDNPSPRQLRLHVREEPGAATPVEAAPARTAGPAGPDAIELQPYSSPTASWRASLPAPPEGKDQIYSMRLSWPVLPGKDGLEVYGLPFRVKVEHRIGGLFPTLLDPPPETSEHATGAEPSDRGGQAASADDTAKFPLEAAALDVHLIEGGREALIHLDGAPYWKRFSFEKNDWMPLPEAADNQALTGNLGALFILNRELHEVHKYRLPGLEPGGTKTLPPGEYTTILAGCDSEHAPVHLVAGNHLMSLDPDTLQRSDVPLSVDNNVGPGFPPSMPPEPEHFFTTGDGLAIVRLRDGTGDVLHYNGDTRRFERTYLGLDGTGFSNEVPGVTAGWSAGDGVRCLDLPGRSSASQSKPADPWQYTRATLSENAPVVFRLRRPNSNELPPRMRLGCFALFGPVPFAEVDAPELAGLLERGLWARDRWIFLDPYSHRLATLSQDRRTWYVRRLEFEAGPATPALLNWPDTTLSRGNPWTFHPILTSGSQFDAKLLGKTDGPTTDRATGMISLSIPTFLPDSLQLLNLQLPGPNKTAGMLYPILLHTGGLGTPFAVPPGTKLARTGLAMLGASRRDLHPLKAVLYRFPDRVKTIVGPVAGYAALVTESGRVDFLSVETRQTAGTFTGSVGATYYAGPNALLEYEPAGRTLTRISVPNGRREQVLTLSANTTLNGIGAGTDRGSPVALAVRMTHQEGNKGLADLAWSRKSPGSGFAIETVAILDGQTFKAGARAQPISLPRLLGKPESFRDEFASLIGVADGPPVLLPASCDGAVFNLARHLLVDGTNYAVAYPDLQAVGGVDLTTERGGLVAGSLTGMMAFSNHGQGYKGSVPVVNKVAGTQDLGTTPDGLYNFYLLNANSNEICVDVCSAENNRPLLRLGQLAFAGQRLAIGGDRFTRCVWMLGEHGPLAVLSPSGQEMELVDLDIPNVARQVAAQDFHVVSQPVPYVMEGHTFQYSVRVNNPAAVQSIRVQSPTGAGLGVDNTVSVTAPNNISAPTYLNIAIEIKGKNGQTLLHEFPVYVLPTPRAGTTTKVGEL